jgi:ketosteroid isomerase-like protein
MKAGALKVAQAFSGASGGDKESLYSLLADDIEWTTPHRTLRGLEEVREKLEWGGEPPEHLDVEWEDGEWVEVGGGRVVKESRVIQRWKETSEVSTSMRVREELVIRDGKIARYERRGRPE